MDILDSQTVVVYNHDDLQFALSNDNGYIYVHMGASFAMNSGIRIHPNKPSLLISGINPDDPSQTIHTLTDFNSSDNTGCLYVNAVSSIQIVFQSLIIEGRNFYGIPCIHDHVGNDAISVSYHNVTYTGPQIIWHPRGLTRFVDCDITIAQGYSPPNEVGEVCRLEIGGVTTIRHNNTTTTNSTFLFYNRGGTSFTILEDADVNISTVNDFFVTEIAMPVTLQARAKLTLTTREGISAAIGYTFNSFHLQADAVFHYTRLSEFGEPNALYMNGAITLERGADFLMVADFAGSVGALVYFISNAGRITLNSPKRFALYNKGNITLARAFYFGDRISFSFTCNQIDYWRAATAYPSAGTFDDVAPWRWYRPQWGIFDVSGTVNNDGITIANTSLTQDEQDLLPLLTDMNLRLARVFAVGVLPLTVNTIVSDMRPVTGQSISDVDIQVTYEVDSVERVCTGRCVGSGAYTVPVEDVIPVSSDVTVAANLRFLLTEVVQLAMAAGELDIYEAPASISFTFNPISSNPVILPRAIPNAPVIISDERVDVDRIQWVLWVKADGPLRTASGLELPESLVFVRKGETVPETIRENYISVHTDGPYEDTEFSIIWDIFEGVLARITAPVRVAEIYTAHLTWTVLPLGTQPEEG